MLNCYSIGGHIVATGNALFSIQLPRKGTIKKIVWSVALEASVGSATNMAALVQLSKRAAVQYGASFEQPTEILDNVAIGVQSDTAVGSNTCQVNKESNQFFPININDALYIHCAGVLGGGELLVDCLLFVQE